MMKTKRLFHNADFVLTVILTVLIALSILIMISGKSQAAKAADEQSVMSLSAVSAASAPVQGVAEEFPFAGKIKGSGVRFREEPDTRTGKILHELNDSVRVEVLGKEGSWYQVKLRDETGYVFEDYIAHVS